MYHRWCYTVHIGTIDGTFERRMKMQYAILNGKIAERGIRKSAIAESLGISPKAFSNKLSGKSRFTWPEACLIQSRFFPDLDKDYLFSSEDDSADREVG